MVKKRSSSSRQSIFQRLRRTVRKLKRILLKPWVLTMAFAIIRLVVGWTLR
jgi:hypothetical protein